jgi:hypothetical protein
MAAHERGYTAIDPAVSVLNCACGKAECRLAPMRPMREHVAALLSAIVSSAISNVIASDSLQDPWPAVLYPLQMAASIEDVFADPSFVDDSGAWEMCSDAWDSDETDREEASKYVAALVFFNFVWAAYEGAITECCPGAPGEKLPVLGRKFLLTGASDSSEFPSFLDSYRMARNYCLRDAALRSKIERSEAKYPMRSEAAAAELARIFRNHIVHGNDAIPPNGDTWSCFRFYSVSKMCLILIQMLVVTRLVVADKVVPLSSNYSDGKAEPAGWLFRRLQLKEKLWVGKSPTSAA